MNNTSDGCSLLLVGDAGSEDSHTGCRRGCFADNRSIGAMLSVL